MASFYEKAKGNAAKIEEQLLGPSYNYASKIKSPRQMRMGSQGTLPQIGRNIKGLVGYADVLISGSGNAQTVSGPLGSKFFMKTGAVCKAKGSGKSVPRYIYINNVPKPPLAGLIKGTTTGVRALNPYKLMGALGTTSTSECRPITLEVVDNNNNRRRETHYMTAADIKSLGSSMIPFGEGFTLNNDDDSGVMMPEDPHIQLYYTLLSIFGVYIIYRLMDK